MIKLYVLIICSSALLIGKSIVINDVYYYSDPTGISLHRPEMDHSETLILAEHDPTTNDGSFDFREIVFYIHVDPSKNQKYIRKSSKSKKKRKTKKKAKPYFSQYGHWSAVHDSMFSYIQVKNDEWIGREFNLVETVITGLKKDGEILKKEERLINQEDIYFTPQLIKYFHSISTSLENDDKYYIEVEKEFLNSLPDTLILEDAITEVAKIFTQLSKINQRFTVGKLENYVLFHKELRYGVYKNNKK